MSRQRPEPGLVAAAVERTVGEQQPAAGGKEDTLLEADTETYRKGIACPSVPQRCLHRSLRSRTGTASFQAIHLVSKSLQNKSTHTDIEIRHIRKLLEFFKEFSLWFCFVLF